jgi:hypothetical protein
MSQEIDCFPGKNFPGETFLFLLLLKNIVHGKKGYFRVEKRYPWESTFPLFYTLRDRKVEFQHCT